MKRPGEGKSIFKAHLQTMISVLIAVFILVMIFVPGLLQGGAGSESYDSSPEETNGSVIPAGETAAEAGGDIDSGSLDGSETEYPIVRDVFLLDTFCDITVYSGGGEEAAGSAIMLLNHFDDIFNPSKESSDIYRINHRNADTVEIEPETAHMLMAAKEFSEESGGVLEPAIEPLSTLWDVNHRIEVPSEEEIAEALSGVKSGAYLITDEEFIALDKDVRIDIGSFAKGYIADRLKEDLLSHGVTSAIINLGGNVLCLGQRPDGTPFRIAVREPGKAIQDYTNVLEIVDETVVTAGIYERYFEADGKIYHHILDVSTGYPAENELESVTVIGPESFTADALCTCIFIMGEEKGTTFLDEYNARHESDYRAIFLPRE